MYGRTWARRSRRYLSIVDGRIVARIASSHSTANSSTVCRIRRDVVAALERGEQLVARGLRVALRAIAGVPSTLAASGLRVSILDDDVPTGALLDDRAAHHLARFFGR